MKAHEYIISEQTQWALNRDIPLIGSKGCRGRRAYTLELNQNLFNPLEPDVCNSFLQADGKEISGGPCSPAKMQAVHSSAALSVNVFQYWKKIRQVAVIAVACGFCPKESCPSLEIRFEDKFPIDGIPRIPPNIDVVFHNADSSQFKRFAVECKFSEPYGLHGDKGLKPAYIDSVTLWSDVPKLYDLAKKICPNDNCFTYCSLAKIDLGIVQKQKYCPEIGNTKLSSEIKRKIPTAGMFEIGDPSLQDFHSQA